MIRAGITCLGNKAAFDKGWWIAASSVSQLFSISRAHRCEDFSLSSLYHEPIAASVVPSTATLFILGSSLVAFLSRGYITSPSLRVLSVSQLFSGSRAHRYEDLSLSRLEHESIAAIIPSPTAILCILSPLLRSNPLPWLFSMS